MDSESADQQGEERRRRVKKKRRVTRVTVDGKEVTGDFLKNPASLSFPDPGKRYRKYIVAGIIVVVVLLSALLFLKISDWAPVDTGGPPELQK